MRRGDFVLAAVPGDYGKPRPALVVQSSLYAGLPSVALCPLTSDLRDDAPTLRILVQPNQENGLLMPSQIAVDKLTTVSITRLRDVIGRADETLMLQVTRSLAVFVEIVTRALRP
jgi:mRNA interferase MazF